MLSTDAGNGQTVTVNVGGADYTAKAVGGIFSVLVPHTAIAGFTINGCCS
jgi:hypothetical protein